MKYPLVQWLVVWEHSKVQQIVGMESKMIGAIGSTYSIRKKGIDQGYQTESGHCWGDTHLDIYGCETWTLQARYEEHMKGFEGVRVWGSATYWSNKLFWIFVHGEEVAAELEAKSRRD